MEENRKPKLLVIGGPTASGKTALAIQLAQQYQTEILSADSRQFYRGMDIGTAKPTPKELAAAPHHFVDFLNVTDDYSVGDFERDALKKLETILKKNNIAILVGGSGLYLRAVCEGLDAFPPISVAIKMQVADAELANGIQYLQSELQRLDPVQFAKIDPQNPARLRRALEVCYESGQPYSFFLEKEKSPRFFETEYLLLDPPRDVLYDRINARVDAMVADGLEAEARSLLPFRHRTALQTVGYAEWFDYFDRNIDRAMAIEKIKQHTRNYAKRQVTWFKKYFH